MKNGANLLFVDQNIFSSTLGCSATRWAQAKGIQLEIGDYKSVQFSKNILERLFNIPIRMEC
jgi:hypothetical protein